MPPPAQVRVGVSIYRQPLAYVQRCLESALGQIDCPVELAIRIDGPENCSADLERYLQTLQASHPNVTLLDDREHRGTFGSYRELFNGCRTPFLAQLDGDDYLSPLALSTCLAALEPRPDASFAYTNCLDIAADGTVLQLGQRQKTPYSYRMMLVRFMAFHLRVVRTASYEAVGGYRPDLLYSGDYDLALKLAEQGEVLFVQDPLYYYRLHGENTSTLQHQATHREAFVVAQDALQRSGLDRAYRLLFNPGTHQVHLLPRAAGPPTCLAIAGMHRSGTSLLAQLIQAGTTAHLGEQLLAADDNNRQGYVEDLDFVNWHRACLAQAETSAEPAAGTHWLEGGWLGDRLVEGQPPLRLRQRAHGLIDRRRQQGRLWGWKDPRTTLYLHFWAERIPQLHYLFSYRSPWECCLSLARFGHASLQADPDVCAAIWGAYNRRLLDYMQDHHDSCLLLNCDALASEPGRLSELLAMHWQLPEPDGRAVKTPVRPELLHPSSGHGLRLWQVLLPESCALWRELQAASHLPMTERTEPASIPALPPGTAPLQLVLTLGRSRLTLAAALAMWFDQAHGDDSLLIHDPLESLDPPTRAALLQLDTRLGWLPAGTAPPPGAIHWGSDMVLTSKDPMLLRESQARP
ncbi:MAG: glycosyltransferase [Cyanobacteria bacterium M_surface_10_m1_298]|nr:glycosyltransferase [Cyanobacteria bacterium M_surface_10_m1_298]